jgi:hypothetical protein
MAASVVSAYIQPLTLPLPPIVFPFNPDGWSSSAEAKWKTSSQPATNGSQPQYQGMEPSKLDVKILLDAFSVPPVPPQATIAELHLFLAPSAISKAMGIASAPIVMFGWGPNIIMEQAIVTKVAVSYHRFLMGVPVRAEATVSLQTVPPPSPLPPTNPTSGGLATRRTHRTVEGDTLASVAYQEYRDPNKWRALAEANGIDDPMRVKPGTELIIPDRREADQLA